MTLSKHRLRKWSVQVRWRDRKCALCGSRDRLQAHHINDKSYHPEQAYDIQNGITLCSGTARGGKRCHIVFHNWFMKSTRHKCTRLDWDRFVRLWDWSQP